MQRFGTHSDKFCIMFKLLLNRCSDCINFFKTLILYLWWGFFILWKLQFSSNLIKKICIYHLAYRFTMCHNIFNCKPQYTALLLYCVESELLKRLVTDGLINVAKQEEIVHFLGSIFNNRFIQMLWSSSKCYGGLGCCQFYFYSICI